MRFAPVSRNLAKLLDIKSLRLLDNYAQFNPVPLSIEQFLAFGQRAMETESYHFLKKELPVRFANIMKEINLLPATLLQMPSVQDLQVCRPCLLILYFPSIILHLLYFTIGKLCRQLQRPDRVRGKFSRPQEYGRIFANLVGN